MAIKGYCGKKCRDCNGCYLDETIPCSPDCENLTEDGKIHIRACLDSGCEEVKYIFDMVGCSNENIIEQYGETALYPYNV